MKLIVAATEMLSGFLFCGDFRGKLAEFYDAHGLRAAAAPPLPVAGSETASAPAGGKRKAVETDSDESNVPKKTSAKTMLDAACETTPKKDAACETADLMAYAGDGSASLDAWSENSMGMPEGVTVSEYNISPASKVVVMHVTTAVPGGALLDGASLNGVYYLLDTRTDML